MSTWRGDAEMLDLELGVQMLCDRSDLPRTAFCFAATAINALSNTIQSICRQCGASLSELPSPPHMPFSTPSQEIESQCLSTPRYTTP